jgi:hypothetical protein
VSISNFILKSNTAACLDLQLQWYDTDKTITVNAVTFDGENDGSRYAIKSNGNLRGHLVITSCVFKNFYGAYIIDTAAGGALFNTEELKSVTFTSNTLTNNRGRIAFRGKLDTMITTVTITGNDMQNWEGATSIDSAFLLTNCKAVTFSTNTIKNIPLKGSLGMGHAVQIWTLESWSLTAQKNTITNNAGAILIVTDIYNHPSDFNSKSFYIPTGTVTMNDFSANSKFGVVVADMVADGAANFIKSTGEV